MFSRMPVIVVGADTGPGEAIIDRLDHPDREVRAFVSDESIAASLRDRGVKVALGDVSDESHVEGAALRCFSAILVVEAAEDGRDRSFAETSAEVLAGWARAVTRSGVKRVIWVTAEPPPAVAIGEVATVDPDDPDLAERVAALDDAQTISRSPTD